MPNLMANHACDVLVTNPIDNLQQTRVNRDLYIMILFYVLKDELTHITLMLERDNDELGCLLQGTVPQSQ